MKLFLWGNSANQLKTTGIKSPLTKLQLTNFVPVIMQSTIVISQRLLLVIWIYMENCRPIKNMFYNFFFVSVINRKWQSLMTSSIMCCLFSSIWLLYMEAHLRFIKNVFNFDIMQYKAHIDHVKTLLGNIQHKVLDI